MNMTENLLIGVLGFVGSIGGTYIVNIINNSKQRAEFMNHLENSQIRQQADIDVLKKLEPTLNKLNDTLNCINTQVAVHDSEIKSLQNKVFI